jgi:16S rRNA (uracil1498-N3)-methyltransferase
MSKPPRFFIDPFQVAGTSITVTGDDLRHIRTVLRKAPGDLLTLLDGRGSEYTVRITEVRQDGISTAVIERKQRERQGPVITLGQGIAKADKMDWIVQKATELGVSSLVPLVTERTIVKVKDEEKRVSRWQKICREAAMQCGRPDIPRVEKIRSFWDFLDGLHDHRTPLHPPLARGEHKGGEQDTGALRAGTLLLLPWEEETRPIKNVLRSYPGAQNIVVLIGPEGGFSQAEADNAREKGFHLVSLGPNILRTETAAVAVLSMIGYESLW